MKNMFYDLVEEVLGIIVEGYITGINKFKGNRNFSIQFIYEEEAVILSVDTIHLLFNLILYCYFNNIREIDVYLKTDSEDHKFVYCIKAYYSFKNPGYTLADYNKINIDILDDMFFIKGRKETCTELIGNIKEFNSILERIYSSKRIFISKDEIYSYLNCYYKILLCTSELLYNGNAFDDFLNECLSFDKDENTGDFMYYSPIFLNYVQKIYLCVNSLYDLLFFGEYTFSKENAYLSKEIILNKLKTISKYLISFKHNDYNICYLNIAYDISSDSNIIGALIQKNANSSYMNVFNIKEAVINNYLKHVNEEKATKELYKVVVVGYIDECIYDLIKYVSYFKVTGINIKYTIYTDCNLGNYTEYIGNDLLEVISDSTKIDMFFKSKSKLISLLESNDLVIFNNIKQVFYFDKVIGSTNELKKLKLRFQSNNFYKYGSWNGNATVNYYYLNPLDNVFTEMDSYSKKSIITKNPYVVKVSDNIFIQFLKDYFMTNHNNQVVFYSSCSLHDPKDDNSLNILTDVCSEDLKSTSFYMPNSNSFLKSNDKNYISICVLDILSSLALKNYSYFLEFLCQNIRVKVEIGELKNMYIIIKYGSFNNINSYNKDLDVKITYYYLDNANIEYDRFLTYFINEVVLNMLNSTLQSSKFELLNVTFNNTFYALIKLNAKTVEDLIFLNLYKIEKIKPRFIFFDNASKKDFYHTDYTGLETEKMIVMRSLQVYNKQVIGMFEEDHLLNTLKRMFGMSEKELKDYLRNACENCGYTNEDSPLYKNSKR